MINMMKKILKLLHKLVQYITLIGIDMSLSIGAVQLIVLISKYTNNSVYQLWVLVIIVIVTYLYIMCRIIAWLLRGGISNHKTNKCMNNKPEDDKDNG